MSGFKVEGLKQLNNALKQLPVRVANKHMNKSASAAASVVAKAARTNLRGISTQEGGSINPVGGVTIKRVERSPEHITYHVGATGKRFYLGFIEIGTAPHIIKPKNKKVLANTEDVLGEKSFFSKGPVMHPGIMMRPWLRPALDNNKEKAVHTLRDKLRAGIKKEAQNLR